MCAVAVKQCWRDQMSMWNETILNCCWCVSEHFEVMQLHEALHSRNKQFENWSNRIFLSIAEQQVVTVCLFVGLGAFENCLIVQKNDFEQIVVAYALVARSVSRHEEATNDAAIQSQAHECCWFVHAVKIVVGKDALMRLALSDQYDDQSNN